ncbi:MAG: hypothetical protein ABID64_01955 [Nitrospirota bacterium]
MIKKLKDKFKQRKIRKVREKEYIENQPSAFDNTVISWTAPEHLRHKRGKIWKVIVAALLIAAIVTGMAHQAWTFSLAIVVFAIVYYLVNREPTKDVEVSISDIGIKVGKRKYPFTRIKSFWLVYEPPYTKSLYVKVDGELVVDISIQLNSQDPSEVREFLIEKIPEKEGHNQSLTEIFSRLLKI